MTSFNRMNEDHYKLAKALYYSWYGPKDAVVLLKEEYNISATTAMLTRLFYSFRVSNIPRYDRSIPLDLYMAKSK